MAQQPQFNVQFQGFTQSQGFDPLKLPDPNPYLQQNLQAISNSFTNLAQSGKLAFENEAVNYEKQAKLAAFIPKFLEQGVQVDKLLDIEARKIALKKVEEHDRKSSGQISQYTGEINQQGNKIEAGLVKGAQEAQQNGAPFNNWDALLKANRGKVRRQLETIIAERMFKGEGSYWNGFLTEQLSKNDGFIDLPAGRFRINDPNLHPNVRTEIKKVLYDKFLEHPIFQHISPDIVSTTSQTYRVALDQADSARYQKTFKINQGQINSQNAIVSVRQALDDTTGQVDLGLALDTAARKYAMQPSANGFGTQGFDKFWDQMTKDAEAAGFAGRDYDFEKLKSAKHPTNGQYLGDVIVDGKLVKGFYGDKIAIMQMSYLKAKNQRFTVQQSSKKRQAIEANNAIIEAIRLAGDDMNMATAMNLRKQAQSNIEGLGMGSREGLIDEIDRSIMSYTPDGKRAQSNLDDALERNFRGDLGTDHPFFRSPFGRAYVAPGDTEPLYKQAERRDQMMNSPEKKRAIKSFNKFVAGDTGTQLSVFEELQGRVAEVAAEFVVRGNAIYESKFAETGSHQEASQAMYTYLENSWSKDTKAGGGHKLYDRGTNGKFDLWKAARDKQLEQGVNFSEYTQPIVDAAFGKDVDDTRMGLHSAIQSKPGLIGTQEELLKFYDDYIKRGVVPPKIIRAFDRINSQSPTKILAKHMDLVVSALKAYNPSFDTKAYEQLSLQQKALSPTDQKFLDCINSGTYCNIKGRMFNINAASNVRDGFPPPVVSTISGPSTYTANFSSFKNGNGLYSYARNELGLSEVHALGLMINAIRESSIRTSNPGDNGTSDGIFQWHAGRLQRARQALGDQWNDPRAQLKYALEEKGEPGQEYLKQKFTSVQEAADWWMRRWERTADPARDSRKHAEFIKKYLTPMGS